MRCLFRATVLGLLLSVCTQLRAQTSEEPYYPYTYIDDAYVPPLETDSLLFYRAVQAAGDLYGEATDFRFASVAWRRRGMDYRYSPVMLDGVEVSSRYLSSFRYLQLSESRMSGLSPSGTTNGAWNGIRRFRSTDAVPLPGGSVALQATDRDFRVGARASGTIRLPREWYLSLSGMCRGGRDARIDGVFDNRAVAALRLVRSWNTASGFSCIVVVPVSQRGLRSSAFEECYALSGDRYYNPAWGYQNGRVRSARIRRETMPFAAATLSLRAGGSSTVAATIGVEAGLSRYSALAWFGAPTPLPDHYRYLPSYFTGSDFDAVDRSWRSSDPAYTQIDWAELYRRNRLCGESVYAVADRVERPLRLQISVRGATEAARGLELSYGLKYDRSDTRRYEQMRDLLGGTGVIDVDYYLVDDDTYSDRLQNDLRRPNRHVGAGDRFGYDYALSYRELGADLAVSWQSDRWSASVSAEVGVRRIFREGFCEKELFPGDGSYGRSGRIRMTSFRSVAAVGYSFSPRTHLRIAGAAGKTAPRSDDLFWQPEYNNRPVDDPRPAEFLAAEVGFTRTGSLFDLCISAFALSTAEEGLTKRYYDDLNRMFCDLYVRGAGRLNLGVEAAAKFRWNRNWSSSVAFSIGRYAYRRNPELTVRGDADNRLLVDRAVSCVSGMGTGLSPEAMAAADIAYFGASGWNFRLACQYAGLRRVAPALLYRTSHVANQVSDSRETFDLFTRQARLDDALTADLTVGKFFRLGRSRLSMTLMVRNLTGNDRIVHSAFESDRIRRLRAGSEEFYRPFARRYLYAYPRSYYLSVSYKW